MEPAAERREHRCPGTGRAPRMRAAMEPAAERREHLLIRECLLGEIAAAMEPAAERREHDKFARRGFGRPAGRNGARR